MLKCSSRLKVHHTLPELFSPLSPEQDIKSAQGETKMRYANEQELKKAEKDNPVVYEGNTASIPTLLWGTRGNARAIERRVKSRLGEAANEIARDNEQKRFDEAEKKTCPRCKGSGHYYQRVSVDTVCFKCGGKGIIYKSGEISNWQKDNSKKSRLCLEEDSKGNWQSLFSEGFM